MSDSSKSSEYGTRYQFTIGETTVTLNDLFGDQELERNDVGNRLWRFLLKEFPYEVVEPVGGDNLEWLKPITIDLESLEEDGDPNKVYTFDTLGWAFINFAKVGSQPLQSVIGSGRRDGEETFASLWEFIQKNELIVRRTLHPTKEKP